MIKTERKDHTRIPSSAWREIQIQREKRVKERASSLKTLSFNYQGGHIHAGRAILVGSISLVSRRDREKKG